MKEKLQKMLADKREQEKNLRAALIDGETKEERAEIGATLQALGAEIAELESVLSEMDKPADNGDDAGAAGERKLNVLAAASVEERGGKEMDKEKEYRAAWLKRLQGNDLTDTEKRDLASANSVIPVETSNAIITKIKELVPLLDEVQLLNVAGSVKFAVEGTVGDAALHTENAQITSASDTLVTVSLDGYEIVKLLRISATVKTMSINAFESWLVEQLARKVSEKIEDFLINGTGTSQPKGIAKSATWTANTNLVEWAGTAPTVDEIMKIIALLPSRHARAGKFLMNRKTFWTFIMPLRDDKKMPIVAGEGAGAYNIFGYPVLLSDFVADGEIYFGNMRMVVANLADDIKVDSSEASGFVYNAVDYRGTAIFDCDIADAQAFVKSAVKAS